MRQKAFTLLEVIVSLGIIVVGLVGSLTLVSFTISGSATSSLKLIAAGLAQEGIETVRNSRDSSGNWGSWYSGISDGSYRAEINTSNFKWTIVGDSTPFEEKLRFNSATGLYFYSPPSQGSLTLFSRGLTVISGPDGEKQIFSEVRWQERGRNRSLKAVGYLYNWK
ncbi:MAG: hypothetical protein A3I88_03225 [Candidatus Portnoybacteria bacterium RIFCSPLOWO2_12_FULL_39_9]|uniref:Uncharacterized protein n=1 Tax=Candidatus Portnoybacteria bacterium RIFCSPHIGHO2_12_FULL_38_9 TaxID=1801997 RepID=A0A1G2FF88_9BACT|nr:MAG: hypothetical protein A3H00_00775 [Candidatus Portnoybacteria bacterium RBG_13_40_8]OGZ36046.1 MAG: hypothetical protein A2646_00830 [Candidatus Portnoybacteria bacterium RIFCSPHIGHO2_02_FULL_39_12]OGZ36735.1 MAG: hypothetical protein A3J64_03330 [Candidatus Portnoybacteria bacterium RIFCSPHIGHO2_12_FULL_38_9]OGZ38094.1 MAG: hypothetical protein A3F21_00930 [Candidatus Portnoybacteria bacterium RIFCSPLOWO2_01_FULL_38_39]OGZ40101.1 MAG: hypothetical protein A3I88_03225 [Candidatus Portnoy